MFERPLTPSRFRRTSLFALLLLIGHKLAAVNRELLLGESKARLCWRQVGEEELQEPKVAQLGGLVRRLIEPGIERLDAEIAECRPNPPPDITAPTVTAPVLRMATGTSMGKTTVPSIAAWTASDQGGLLEQQVHRQVDGGAWVPVALSSLAVRTVSGSAPSESSTAITRRGTWTSRTSTYAWGGRFRTASRTGASASLTFSGRGVAFVSRRSYASGKVKVYLDGTLKATINLYGSSRWRRLAYATTFAAAGTHTIKLVVVGTPGHPGVNLDGIVVLR